LEKLWKGEGARCVNAWRGEGVGARHMGAWRAQIFKIGKLLFGFFEFDVNHYSNSSGTIIEPPLLSQWRIWDEVSLIIYQWKCDIIFSGKRQWIEKKF